MTEKLQKIILKWPKLTENSGIKNYKKLLKLLKISENYSNSLKMADLE